jgi:hypothetical protein
MYHPDHHFQQQTAKHDQSGRPCSWLYGIFVLNPNGNVSPCCASAGDATDFGNYSVKNGFFDVWNNSTFKRARALFNEGPKQSSEPVVAPTQERSGLVQIETKTAKQAAEDSAEFVAGMGSNISDLLAQDELICRKCPIPWRQDDVHAIIAGEVRTLSEQFWERGLKKKAAALAAYLLMGAPNLGEQRKLLFQRARASLHYRLAN